MSGTRRISAHTVEILADTPIVGPVPTSNLLSAQSNALLGYSPVQIGVTFVASPLIAPGASYSATVLGTGSATYFPDPTGWGFNVGSVSHVGNQVNVANVHSLFGTVHWIPEIVTNKAVPTAQQEVVTLSVDITDNLGNSTVASTDVQITQLATTSNRPTMAFPFCLPFNSLRTSVQFAFSLTSRFNVDAVQLTANSSAYIQITK